MLPFEIVTVDDARFISVADIGIKVKGFGWVLGPCLSLRFCKRGVLFHVGNLTVECLHGYRRLSFDALVLMSIQLFIYHTFLKHLRPFGLNVTLPFTTEVEPQD